MLQYHHSKTIRNLLGVLVLATAASVAIATPNIEKHDIAADMKVSNFSKNDLSFSINNNCAYSEIGIISERGIKVIPRKNINDACQVNPTHCKAQVYPTINCSGSSIVTLTFDVTGQGVISIVPHTDTYHVEASGFNISFYDHWMADTSNK